MAEEAAVALDATDKDVSIGGAGLAAAAIELGLVDELRILHERTAIYARARISTVEERDQALERLLDYYQHAVAGLGGRSSYRSPGDKLGQLLPPGQAERCCAPPPISTAPLQPGH